MMFYISVNVICVNGAIYLFITLANCYSAAITVLNKFVSFHDVLVDICQQCGRSFFYHTAVVRGRRGCEGCSLSL